MASGARRAPNTGSAVDIDARIQRALRGLLGLKKLEQQKLVQPQDQTVIDLRKQLMLEYLDAFSTTMPRSKPSGNKMRKNLKNCPTNIFICYSHSDDEFQNARWHARLKEHLGMLELQESITVWSDEKIQFGADWRREVENELNAAAVAVLLVGPSFLSSVFIRNSELPVLLTNAKNNGVEILPIIVRHCQFDKCEFNYPDSTTGPHRRLLSDFQAANSITQPLLGLPASEQDRILKNVADRIHQIVNRT